MFSLQEKLRSAASHGLVSYLLSLGMALTLLAVTGLTQSGAAAALLLALNAGLAVAGLNRRVALGAGCIALFTGGIWLAIGGAGMLTECFRALVLHLSGLTAALPMVGVPFTVLVCVLCTAVSWFVTQRSAGAYPAVLLLVLGLVLMWLGNQAERLICLLPAVLACVTLLLRAGDERISTLRVLPLAAVVTGIAFAGVAAGGVVSKPMKDLADSIRQRIYDTFFYTQPRDVFSLASEGYYPQGKHQLGGPATPHDQPVMAVITPRKTYLRGVVKNVYTGRAWMDDIGGRRYLWASSRFDDLRHAAFDQQLPNLDGRADTSLLTPRLLQVRMLADSSSTMFVPQRIRRLQPEGSLIPYFNCSSEIFATSNLKAGDVWTMEAALFTSEDSGLFSLVQSAENAADPNWASVCENNLQLHDQIDRRVYDMASQMTAQARTPYDKALALQHFLAGNFVYTLDVAEQPVNQDFVSTFLVETQEGYCTYFASAMTVMCRMVGLPARYVEGYVAYPDEEGLAVVTGQEAHAWTEVYFRGFGWVTFDATPVNLDYTDPPLEDDPFGGSEDPEPSPEPSSSPDPTPSPSPRPEDAPSPEPEDQPSPSAPPDAGADAAGQDAPENSAGGLGGGILLLLLLALLALRWFFVQPDNQAKRQKDEFRRWLVYVQATHDALRRLGFTREMSETPADFLKRAAKNSPFDHDLRTLAGAENLMFYASAMPYAEETAQARACFRAVYAALTPLKKLVFQLERVFLPAGHFDITRR